MVLSKNISIPTVLNLTTDYIESYLNKKYNDVIRWAIVEADSKNLKICVSYNHRES